MATPTNRGELIGLMSTAFGYANRHPSEAEIFLMLIEASGLVILPKEPTREMWGASGTAIVNLKSGHHDAISEAVFFAMIEASPFHKP